MEKSIKYLSMKFKYTIHISIKSCFFRRRILLVMKTVNKNICYTYVIWLIYYSLFCFGRKAENPELTIPSFPSFAVCYLHIQQIAISQERTAIWKNSYRWSSFIISRVHSNKTNLIFISYTL